MTKTFTKDIDAVLDYMWDWSDWLGFDSIEATNGITFTTTDELVVDAHSETGGKITAWISGGILNNPGIVTCKIVTTEGRTDKRSAIFEIKAR